MLFLAGKNELNKWRRLYIFMQYMMSLIYYGSHQLLLCKDNLGKMLRSTDYNLFEKIIIKHLK